MAVDPQALGQFFGYVIVVVGAHWVTRGSVRSDLAELKKQIADVSGKLDSHDRRIDAVASRIDFIMLGLSKGFPGEPPAGTPERRHGYPGDGEIK